MSFPARWATCTALMAFVGVWAKHGIVYALWTTPTVVAMALFGLLAAISSYACLPSKDD